KETIKMPVIQNRFFLLYAQFKFYYYCGFHEHMTRIVYIEDDASSRSMMYLILSRSGYEFVGAANGQDGIEQVISQQPDLVLLDINWPDMDGFQILKILRDEPRTQHIPIVA